MGYRMIETGCVAKEIYITKPLAVGMKLMAKGLLFIVEQFCKIIFLNYINGTALKNYRYNSK